MKTDLPNTSLSSHAFSSVAGSRHPLVTGSSPSRRAILQRSLLALSVFAANAGALQLPDGIISFDQNGNSVHKRLSSDSKKGKTASASGMVMMSANQAALIAKQHSGGKVLKVSPFGQSQRVKLLLPGGKITHLTVDASGRVK